MTRILKSAASLVALTVCISWSAYGQTGTITGTVKDQSGAVLPGVAISITNVGTNARRDFVTDERGNYTVPLLPVGTYDVQAELAGFKTGLAQNIKLNLGDSLRIDLSLEVGQITERLVVTEAAPLVQSETSSVGNVIDNQKVVELPLNGRQFESLSQLVPGAVSPAPGSTLGFRGGFNAGGARETANSITLDGIDNNDPAINNFTVRPIVDAIQEFKVQTNSYSAEFGRGGGAQVTVSTKSGTNEFHGALWEFLRNDKLDARDFFNTRGDKPPLRRNQFGGTLGGPVRLPGYDGRDHTFFFFAYEGIRRRQQFTSLQQVPTLAFRQGDFSALSTPLRDPLNNNAPFLNNQIPANRVHPIALRILNRGSYPVPTPGLAGSNNLFVVNPFPNDVDQLNARIDHRIGDSNTMFGRYSYTTDRLTVPCRGNGATACVPGFGHSDITHAQSFSIVDTHVFTPRFINEYRAGYNRQVQPRIQFPANSRDVSAELGIPASKDPNTFGHPLVQVTGYGDIGDRAYQTRAGNTYQMGDTITYTLTSHSIRAGYDVRKLEFNATPGTRESLVFNNTWSGNAFADFLLGLPTQTTRDPSDSFRHHRMFTHNAFVQDDWKISGKLTLNLGLRYEINTPEYDKFDRYAQYNVENGRYEIAGQNGVSRAMYRADKNNFGPRVGFAMRPTGKSDLVVRGGYGVFYDLVIIGNNLDGTRRGFPFQRPETFNRGTSPGDLTLSDPYPSARLTTPVFNAPSIHPGFRDAYIQQWNLGIQQEVRGNTVVEVGYIGNRGTRLTRTNDINQAFLPVPGVTPVPPVQSRRPFSQYGTINLLESSANSNYHALLGRFERRFSGGLSFLSSYTYGHVIDDSTGGNASQDARNLQADKASANFDARQRLVVSYIYDVPFGKDRQFGSNLPAVANAILGGWQVAGITTFQSGRPVDPGLQGQNSNTGSTRDRPNATGINPVIQNRTSRTVYGDPAAFTVPSAGTFGNAGRNSFDGPGTNNFDFTLGKNFRRENMNVQFRAEFFNAFNRPFLNQPERRRDNPAYGTITSTLRDNRQIQFGLKIVY